jgi:hypothetical protein
VVPRRRGVVVASAAETALAHFCRHQALPPADWMDDAFEESVSA